MTESGVEMEGVEIVGFVHLASLVQWVVVGLLPFVVHYYRHRLSMSLLLGLLDRYWEDHLLHYHNDGTISLVM